MVKHTRYMVKITVYSASVDRKNASLTPEELTTAILQKNVIYDSGLSVPGLRGGFRFAATGAAVGTPANAAAQTEVKGEAVAKVVLVINDDGAFNADAAKLEHGRNVTVITVDLSEKLSGVGSLDDIKILGEEIKRYEPDEVYTYFTNQSTINILSAITGVNLRDISDKGRGEALAYLAAV